MCLFSLMRRAAVFSIWLCFTGALFLGAHFPLHAQTVEFIPTIIRVAGTAPDPQPVVGAPSNGPATSATLNSPEGIAFDKAGDLYIVDSGNGVVRKVDTNGTITTVAGGGSGACANATDTFGDGCPATDAAFTTLAEGGLARVALDSAGDLYISDYGACIVHKVDRITNIMTDYAGSPQGCNGTDVDGPIQTARINGPSGLAFDAFGNLYIADFNSGRIREVLAGDMEMTTVAGLGSAPCSTSTDSVGDGCPANSTSVSLSEITDLATDAQGNLYVSDQGHDIVRKITIPAGATTGVITLFAGVPNVGGYSGDGGPATAANLRSPKGLVIDGSGDVYIADHDNAVVREVGSSGTITTVAGNSYFGFSGDNGIATNASMNYPLSLALNSAGDLYISEYNNAIVRKVDLSGITAFLPTSVGQTSMSLNAFFQVSNSSTAAISTPAGLKDFAVGATNCAGTVCSAAITFNPQVPGERGNAVQVAVGGATSYFALTGIGNAPLAALTPGVITTNIPGLAEPAAVAADTAGNLYVADDVQNTITKISASGSPTSVATGLDRPKGVAVDAAGDVYIANTGGGNVLKILAGGGSAIPIVSGLTAPEGVAVDASGNVYVSDMAAGDIVKIPATGGAHVTIATGLSKPAGIAVDDRGNLYIVEQGSNKIDEISAASGTLVSLPIAGLDQPNSIAADAAGNLYISETSSEQVVRVDAVTRSVSVVAGSGNAGYTGDGGAATLATLSQPAGIALDGTGNLYIADSYNQVVRKVAVNPAATLAFAVTAPGTTSSDSPKSANVNNIGNEPLTIQSIAIASSPDAGSFALENGSLANACAASLLASGASCEIGVSFTPLSTGTLNAAALLTDNALNVSGSAQSVPLSGSAAPQYVLTWYPSSLQDVYGTPLGTGVLDATVSNGGQGTITYAAQSAGGAVMPVTAATVLPQAGTYTLTATSTLAGAANSQTETFVVTKAASVLSLQASSTTTGVGATVVLTATATSSTTGVPTGSLTFYSGTTQLGTAVLNARGVASLSVDTLAAGSDIISAAYGGDVNFLGTTAQLAQPIVTGASGFSISATPASSTVKEGKPAEMAITITSHYGFNGTINLSCLHLPAGATCYFAPATVTLDGSSQPMSSQLTVNTWGGMAQPAVAANRTPKDSSRLDGMVMASIFWLPGILLGGFLGTERKKLKTGMRPILTIIAVVFAMAGMLGGLTGCADLTPDAAIGSYQVTVVATSANGQTQSLPLQLTIVK